ncbi:hypothetical protein GCM10023107_87170 [Actinoplanes octamycinicus]|nr:hypothetical protein Aoc01nite_88360 [Actinoplanes octamycinicus]
MSPSPGSLVGVAFVVVFGFAGAAWVVASAGSLAAAVAAGALLLVVAPASLPVVEEGLLEQAAVSARAPRATDVNRPARFNT